MTTSARRWLTRLTTGTTTAGLLALGLPALTGPPPAGPATGEGAPHTASSSPVLPAEDLRPVSHKARHPHRKIKLYRVRNGDTASSIAVRYHAWTDQLVAINHTSTLYVGQVIRIPVVVKAARKCTRHRHHFTGYLADNKHAGEKNPRAQKHESKKPHKAKHQTRPKKQHPKRSSHRHPDHGWVHAHASRAEVRHLIVKKARRVGVNPDLALAIAWQESGWQHHVKSSAGALGAMQVMPGTGRWMSAYLGRDLNLRDLHDNVSAGVVLIKLLRSQAKLKHAVAGYYQGLAGVRRYGMYRSTKRYVANVLALKKALERGWNPA